MAMCRLRHKHEGARVQSRSADISADIFADISADTSADISAYIPVGIFADVCR